MSTKKLLWQLLEQIKMFEERGREGYDRLAGQLSDPEVAGTIAMLRSEESKHIQIAEDLLALLRKYTVPAPARHAAFVSLPLRYILIGVVLGLGAPSGSLILKYLISNGGALSSWALHEISLHRWFYLYMSVGTVIAFSFSGGIVGYMHAALKLKTRQLATKARLLEDISAKDPLTGLYNFGYMRERIAIEIERSRRFQTPLSCLMLDIDNLKQINDGRGHRAGDALLASFADLIQKEIRLIDTATRYGGDEFFILLPVTAHSGAQVVAERIRRKVREHHLEFENGLLATTISIGIASFPAPDITDVDSLIEAADQAVYEAKQGGKDKTVLSSTVKTA